MPKPTLLLDMDGPMADFDLAIWTNLRPIYDLQFDIPNLAAQRHRFLTDHLDKFDASLLRYHIDTDPHWFSHLPVTHGAVEGVSRLEERFDVWVCTKPLEVNPGCRDGKQRWIDRHFPTLSKKLIMAPDKSMIHGAVLLDDAPKLAWIDDNQPWRPMVYRLPWNGPDSVWGHLPRWDWTDDVDVLWRYATRSTRAIREEMPA